MKDRGAGCSVRTPQCGWCTHLILPSQNWTQDVEETQEGRNRAVSKSATRSFHITLWRPDPSRLPHAPPFPQTPNPEQGIHTITYLTPSPVCQLNLCPRRRRCCCYYPTAALCSAFLHGSCAYRLPYPSPWLKGLILGCFNIPGHSVAPLSLSLSPGKGG